jgi:raffinose/stachyose/melibiose transport system substrate-binding protein
MLRKLRTRPTAILRWSALASLVAALAAALVGASTVQAKSSATTLRVATITAAQDAWEALAKNFERAYPDVDVQMEFYPVSTYAQTLLTQLQGGNAPDVIAGIVGGRGQANSVLALAAAGRLADLSKEPWVKRLPAQARPLFAQGKRVWSLPLALNTTGMVYNVDLFRQYGLQIPKTFAQLLNVCRAGKERGVVPVVVAAAIFNNAGLFGSLLAVNTVYGPDPTWNTKRLRGTVKFAGSARWRAVFEQVQRMKDAGCFSPDTAAMGLPQVFGLLANGRALMWTGPSVAMAQAAAVNPSVNLAQFPFPGATAAATRAMAAFVDGASVNATSKNLVQAKRFVSFIAREGQSRLYAKATTSIALHDANVLNVPPKVKTFVPFLKSKKFVANPYLEWINADAYVAFANGITGLFSGQTTNIDDALRRIDDAWAKGPA